jgi:hypothetical protein
MRQNGFDENSLFAIPHPPYSSDPASSDSWLFGHIDISLASRVFNDVKEFLEMLIEF